MKIYIKPLFYITLFAICTIVAAPFISPVIVQSDYFYANKDVLFYTNLLQLFLDHFYMGELYPRWFAEANGGIGSNAMLFYAPLSLALTALTTGWLSLAGVDILYIFYSSMVVALICASMSAYLWLKRHFPVSYALVGALFYIAVPYTQHYIYLHMNLATLWAMVWLPLWMIAAERIGESGCRNRRSGLALYAICTGLVFMTHPLTCIAFIAVPTLYAFVQPNIARLYVGIRLIVAYALAVLLSAIYWLPFVMNKSQVQFSIFTTDNNHYANHFFHIDTFLNLYYAIIALLALALWSRFKHQLDSSLSRKMLLFCAILAGTAFLTFRISQPIWEFITPLQYLQYPATRLHVAAIMCCVFITTYYFWAVRSHALASTGIWQGIYTPAIVLILLAVAWPFHINFMEERYSCYITYPLALLHEMRTFHYLSPPEYLPKELAVHSSDYYTLQKAAAMHTSSFGIDNPKGVSRGTIISCFTLTLLAIMLISAAIKRKPKRQVSL